MASQAIYTLANDTVYDQLVALLNSLEVNVSADIPIVVIPYDDSLDLVKQEIASRTNIQLYENWDSIQRWSEFVHQVWEFHPRAKETNKPLPKWYKKTNVFRKFCAFDGEYDKFVFYDADSLAMKPIDGVWSKLNEYDFVFDDWEHAKPRNVAAFDFDLVEKTSGLPESLVRPQIHCSSFFGSKRGIFGVEELEKLKESLIKDGEIAWINPLSWWFDPDLFSYLTWRSDRSLFNFTTSPNGQDRTGNCADADPFVNIDNILYNEDGLKPIYRIHYMNYSSEDFARLCRGEDVDILYKDVFLHYRFLKQPELRPKQLKPPSIMQKTNRLVKKTVNKFKKIVAPTRL